MAKITGAKVFTVPTQDNAAEDRMGAQLTRWIADNPFVTMEEKHVVQSDSFLSVLVFYSGQAGENSPL